MIPATGGIFTVYLTHTPALTDGNGVEQAPQEILLWDRKAEGGFPETKILKQLLRNHIEPGRDLGHSDKPSAKKAPEPVQEASSEKAKDCEDCK